MRSVRFLTVVAVGPACVLTAAFVCVVVGVLPAPSRLAVFGFLIATAAGLVSRRCEPAALRILHGARRPAGWESEALAPVVTTLCRCGIGPPLIDVYVAPGTQVGAWAAGRRGVVVTNATVAALADGRVTVEEIAARMTHAVGVLDVSASRCDLLIDVLLLPWRLVSAVVRGTGLGLGGLVGFAWRVRGVVVAVAVVQAFTAGQIGTVILLLWLAVASWLSPAAARAVVQRVNLAADRFVVVQGLGRAWAHVLSGQPSKDHARERLHALQVAATPTPTPLPTTEVSSIR